MATKTASKTAGKSNDKELMAQIKEMKDAGKSWEEIVTKTKVGKPRAELLYFQSLVKPKDRIKGEDDEVGAAIVEARDEMDQSWGFIMARTGMGLGKVRKLYEEHSGSSAAGSNVASNRKSKRDGDEPAKPKAKAASKRGTGKAKTTSRAKAARGRAGKRGSKAKSTATTGITRDPSATA